MSTTVTYFIQALTDHIGREAILTDPGDQLLYSYDNSSWQTLPSVVVFATEIAPIQTIVKLCRQFHMPITVRGAGTATTGAATPIAGGLVLCLTRMNRLDSLDSSNRLMVVEPGITNQAVQTAAQKAGFFWAPDPSSASICTVGGNLACNAAGPHAIKYGATRENTLGLKFITGEGELLHTGSRTTKAACGYDLTRLLIGSEGTLGIIVEATLKLTPLPQAKITLRASYDSLTAAACAVAQIMAQPIIPSALEFIDEQGLLLLKQQANLVFAEKTKALLLIEVDGMAHALAEHTQSVRNAAQSPGLIEIKTAQDARAASALWQARKALSPALRTIAPKKINEDVVIPVGHIPAFIEKTQKLAKQYDIIIVNFGHAGNGNIHVNLLIHPENPAEMIRADACLAEIFDVVLSLNGTLSGEHGIGLTKKSFMPAALGEPQLALMKKIKSQFDPDNILNPGKIF